MQQRCDLCVSGGDIVRCDQCPLMLCQEFAPSDEELEAYRKGEEWDPKLAEQRRRVKVRLHCTLFILDTGTLFKITVFHNQTFFLLTSGNGSTGRSYIQSDKEARDVSELQLQRQV